MGTAGAIISEDPAPMSLHTDNIPPLLQHTVKKTLAKDPKRRYQLVYDVKTDLQDVIEESGVSRPEVVTEAIARPSGLSAMLNWGLIFLLAAVAGVSIWAPWRKPVQVEKPVSRFRMALPEGHALFGGYANLAISPDGSKLVYRSGDPGELFLKRIDEFESQPLPGTEAAKYPFFSSDGDWVGFNVERGERTLKKVSLRGGSPHIICKAGAAFASWGEDGTIVFAGYPTAGLFKVHSDGGDPEQITSTGQNFEKDETWHFFPQLLPGGEYVLFTGRVSGGKSRLAVISLNTGERKTVLERASQGRYIPTGHLVCLMGSEADLYAVPFDLESLEVVGFPVPVQAGLRTITYDRGHFAISDNGTLVYAAGGPAQLCRPIWIDHEGNIEAMNLPADYYRGPRVSPDGRQLSLSTSGNKVSVLIGDLSRATLRYLTDEEGKDWWPIWNPSGQELVFTSDCHGNGILNLYRKPVDGSRAEERLAESEGTHQQPWCWTPDGMTLVFTEDAGSETGYDIWTLSLDNDEKRQPLIATKANEAHPSLSPDGRWLAYASEESGRRDVYVRSFPDLGAPVKVSTNGGQTPIGSPHSDELFYRVGRDLFCAASF
jgi:serine/threonine-protein kinase